MTITSLSTKVSLCKIQMAGQGRWLKRARAQAVSTSLDSKPSQHLKVPWARTGTHSAQLPPSKSWVCPKQSSLWEFWFFSLVWPLLATADIWASRRPLSQSRTIDPFCSSNKNPLNFSFPELFAYTMGFKSITSYLSGMGFFFFFSFWMTHVTSECFHCWSNL